MTGICRAAFAEDSWQCAYSPVELLRLANVLNGAEHFRRMRFTPANVELAVTMPLVPSYLEKELAASLGRPGGFLSTGAAFTRIAQTATKRLVVMTPYIDASGFRWLRRIFKSTTSGCQRIAILRNAQRYAVDLSVQHAEWLRTLEVEVRDYHVSHDASVKRTLPIETFHAKIVVADEQIAYVGSANLLSSSESISLETGFIVEGQPAVQVARLVDGVLRVARRL